MRLEVIRKFVKDLRPQHAITLIALMAMGLMAAMVWRAWTYHYPDKNHEPPVATAPGSIHR